EQRLTATDRTMLAVDRMLRRLGGSGFETQMFVLLADRIDSTRLRAAVNGIAERYPVITARLAEADGPSWRFRPGAEGAVREADLPSAGHASLLDYASRLLSRPCDLAGEDPIRFHLLHRPDGRDVFLMQYNHALMDNNATVLLLREIDRSSGPTSARGEAGGA